MDDFNLTINWNVNCTPLQVNQKMILTLTASIMFWSLQQPGGELDSVPTSPNESPLATRDGEDASVLGGEASKLTIDDRDSSQNIETEEPSTNNERRK